MNKKVTEWINHYMGFPQNAFYTYLEFHDISILEGLIEEYGEYCGKTDLEEYIENKSPELLEYFNNDMDKVCDVLNIMKQK